MSTKFTMTVLIQCSGEYDLTADHCHVETDPKLTIVPALMQVRQSTEEPYTEEEQKVLTRIIAYNVVHRAQGELYIPNVTTGVPMPIVNVPPTERS